MLANLFGITVGSPSTSVVNFIPIHSISSTPTATETARLQVVPAAFTLKNLYVSVNNAPGTGKSYVFTVRKNQVDTALTVTIAESNISATDAAHTVTFAAGDTISIGITPSGTPTAPTTLRWNLQSDSGDPHFAPLLGGAQASAGLSTSAVSYAGLIGATAATLWTATEPEQQIIIPCGGTIDNLYVISDAAPTSGKSYDISLVKNGSATSLLATVSGTGRTGNDTTHSVAVATGDTLSISATPTGTPTVGRYCWGLKFMPTNPGESFVGFGNANAPSTTATQYEAPFGQGSGYSATESTRQIAPGPCTVTAFYAALGTAPGGAATRTLTIRRNAVSSSLAVSFTGANTTGNIAGQAVGINQTDLVGMQAAATGTPAVATGGVHTGLLLFTPTTTIPTNSFFAVIR